MRPYHRVLLTANRDSPVWDIVRADVESAYLPFGVRELIEGRVNSLIVESAEYESLRAYLAALPGARDAVPPLIVADAPPDEPVERTERAIVAEKLAEIIRHAGATVPVGGDIMRAVSGRYYCVLFGTQEYAGSVHVYGTTFIRVALRRFTDDRPWVDSRVFDSPDYAGQYLALLLHRRDVAAANAVPVRPRKDRDL